MPAIQVVEGTPFVLPPEIRDDLRRAAERVEARLRPRSSVLEEKAGQFVVRGVVGTIALGAGVTLDIAPKTQPNEEWIEAVLDLLAREDRIEPAGDRRAGFAEQRNLLDVLAGVYAERLRRAI